MSCTDVEIWLTLQRRVPPGSAAIVQGLSPIPETCPSPGNDQDLELRDYHFPPLSGSGRQGDVGDPVEWGPSGGGGHGDWVGEMEMERERAVTNAEVGRGTTTSDESPAGLIAMKQEGD